MARRHVDDAAHVNEFHGDAHTVIQARTIRELHVYGVSVYLTPLPGWAAARRAASAVALFAVGFFLLATGLMAEKRGAAGWLLAVAGLAVLTAAGAWGQLVWKRWQLSRGRYENLLQARLDALTASLTRAQRLQWRSEVIARGVQDAKLMPVRYRSAGDDLQGHRPGTQLGAGPAQPRLDGEAGDIAELYDTLRARRLVVLGKPGAGKSVTALRFALDKVEHRQPGDRLPVILSIGSWDPAEHGLWQWAAGRLAIENPQLAKPTGFGTTLAEELAAPERLLLILDGFDELPAGWRPQALRVLNDSLDERTHLVLMGRTRAYRDAALQSGVLAASVAVQLEPLTGNELIGHLDAASHRTRVDGSPLWEPVAARVRDAGSDPLGARLLAALSTPLMAALALTAYTAAPADPAELLDAGAFPTAASIESHLIDQLIPAVYDLPPGVGIRPAGARRRRGAG